MVFGLFQLILSNVYSKLLHSGYTCINCLSTILIPLISVKEKQNSLLKFILTNLFLQKDSMIVRRSHTLFGNFFDLPQKPSRIFQIELYFLNSKLQYLKCVLKENVIDNFNLIDLWWIEKARWRQDINRTTRYLFSLCMGFCGGFVLCRYKVPCCCRRLEKMIHSCFSITGTHFSLKYQAPSTSSSALLSSAIKITVHKILKQMLLKI